MNDDKLLTVKEVAEYLRKHPRTIRRWIEAKKLKAQPIPGRGRIGTEYLIKKSDLDTFLKDQQDTVK